MSGVVSHRWALQLYYGSHSNWCFSSAPARRHRAAFLRRHGVRQCWVNTWISFVDFVPLLDRMGLRTSRKVMGSISAQRCAAGMAKQYSGTVCRRGTDALRISP